MAAGSSSHRFGFPRRFRLSGAQQFDAVFANAVRTRAGPLIVFSRPNALNHLRVGLAVSRHVGTAVQRNLIKRRLREAFRAANAEWRNLPKEDGYDLVIKVSAHAPLAVSAYRELLAGALADLHLKWRKKRHPVAISERADDRTLPKALPAAGE